MSGWGTAQSVLLQTYAFGYGPTSLPCLEECGWEPGLGLKKEISALGLHYKEEYLGIYKEAYLGPSYKVVGSSSRNWCSQHGFDV